MTYRFGRTSKARYAATVSGIPAYQTEEPAPVARGYALTGCHYDESQKKIVCTDTGDPLAFPTSSRSKPSRRKKRKSRARVKKRRASATRAVKCPKGMKPSNKPGVNCELAR